MTLPAKAASPRDDNGIERLLQNERTERARDRSGGGEPHDPDDDVRKMRQGNQSEELFGHHLVAGHPGV
jgi:hypothetical protein